MSVHEATDLHQAFDFTQFPELRIALGAYRSRFPAVDRLRLSAALPPLRRSRPCRGPSVRPAYVLALHRGLATLLTAALRVSATAGDDSAIKNIDGIRLLHGQSSCHGEHEHKK